MSDKEGTAAILWDAYLDSAVGKRVEVSRYATLRATIPDKQLIIQDAIHFEQADEIAERFRPYLEERDIYPILGTLGGSALCVGTRGKSWGVVFYLDFDFGIIELGGLRDFMEHLTSGP